METWLVLNGGKIEKNYLIKNILLAKEEKQFAFVHYQEEGHAHCEVCSTVISNEQTAESVNQAYFSNDVWVCEACYSLFILNDYTVTIQKLPRI